MVRPFVDRKGQSRGVASLTTSTLASADIDLSTPRDPAARVGATLQESGIRRLKKKKAFKQRGVHLYQQRVRLGWLFGQTTVLNLRPLFKRYEQKSAQRS